MTLQIHVEMPHEYTKTECKGTMLKACTCQPHNCYQDTTMGIVVVLDHRSKSELDICGQMTYKSTVTCQRTDVQQMQKHLPLRTGPQNSPKHIQLSLCHPGHGTKSSNIKNNLNVIKLKSACLPKDSTKMTKQSQKWWWSYHKEMSPPSGGTVGKHTAY